ncbi:prolipoprotein diacylglyceryl transferase [Nocardioides sp. GY 10127]|nr:prolipoprotein diacylglyceryl transferase [Nocardioides sp. GY 10127]
MTPLTAPLAVLAIPSPSEGVWYLGPIPIRAYALCIIAGIVAAVWIGERRWMARGGRYGDVQDLALWAVPFGLVGARLYHVLTEWERYFGPGGDPWGALYVWRGGLGIWGGVALGAVGIAIGARRKGLRLAPVLDALAPGVLVAQAMGRWGNYFNQELYGKPTTLPWGLEIDPDRDSVRAQYPADTLFQPTFLYESLWDLGAFFLVIWLDRRFKLGHGRVLAAYVMAYTAGRAWIEYLRIDSVELSDVGGLRWNVWVALVCFLVAAVYFAISSRLRPGRETDVLTARGHALRDEEPGEEPAEDTAEATAEEPAEEPGDDEDPPGAS